MYFNFNPGICLNTRTFPFLFTSSLHISAEMNISRFCQYVLLRENDELTLINWLINQNINTRAHEKNDDDGYD